MNFKIKKEDKTIIITTLILGLINFFYLLSHNVLSNDALANGKIYLSKGWEMDLGRPLLLVIDRLRGGLVSPQIIITISLIIIAICSILLVRIFEIKNKYSIILITILLVLYPTISESALYIYCFDSYSLALLTSILGIFFIKEKKPLYAIISIIASLSLYQAYISITITGVFILYILELLENKNDFKAFIKNMFIILGGLISYFIILKFGMIILGRQLANYKGANSFGIETILSLPKSILNAYLDFFNYFFKETIIYNSYYYRNIINALLFIITLIILFIQSKKIDNKNRLFLAIAIILFPIATNIMNLIACSTRINLVTGIGFVMFYILFINLITKYINKDIYKYITYFLVIILSYTFILSNNGTFMAKEDTHNNYYSECQKMLNKAYQLDDYNDNLNWMITDIFRYQSNITPASNGYLARDYETYDNYLGIKETEIFIKRFFGKNIYIIEEEDYHKIAKTKEFKNMKVGEVKIINSTIVYKNSENIAY